MTILLIIALIHLCCFFVRCCLKIYSRTRLDAINYCIFVRGRLLILPYLRRSGTLVVRFVSQCLFFIICLIAFFWWNDFVCSSFQSNLLFFIFFLCESNGRSGADICDRLGMNFCKWCTLPISDLSCFRVFGGSIFMMASVFRFVGFIPSAFILYPNYYISVTANSHLCWFIAKFSLSNRAST